jgi:hypothetical protein
VTTVELTAPTTSEAIFAVLADGWLYASWVVGASHIRKVDDGWPQPGTRIHHAVGVWPLPIKDTTSVIRMEPNRLLELDARAWPLGRARVLIELEPAENGRTRIRMTEKVVAGPGTLIPEAVQDPLLRARNRESLRRLIDIALGREAA